MGAMENAGAVTLRDEYLPRSRQDASFYEFRCSVILHEMAHMWFGDLVTMKWWDDLWLNESFAEWACYHAAVEATEFDESWTGFTNARKNWALRQDQLPSTHPIAADNYDLQAVEVNFDGITYAKGASVLKQLVAWVGLDNFLVGLRAYFQKHAFGNSEFSDLLSALEESSGRELDSWAKEWLQTSGVNTLTPRFELDADGQLHLVLGACRAPRSSTRRCAGTGSASASTTRCPTGRRRPPGPSYERRGGRRGRDDRDRRAGRRPPARPAAAQRRRPDLRQDPARRALAGDRRRRPRAARRLARPGAVLGRRVGHDPRRRDERDRLRRRSCSATSPPRPTRSAPRASPAYAAQAVNNFSAPANRAALRATWEQGVRRLLDEAEPGSDHQLTFARAFAVGGPQRRGARRPRGPARRLARPRGPHRSTPTCAGRLLGGLARAGRADEDAHRRGAAPRQHHLGPGARRRRPRRPADGRGQGRGLGDRRRPRRRPQRDPAQRGARRSCSRARTSVLAPYVEKYLEMAETLWEEKGTQRASTALEYLFPRPLASRELLDRVERLAAGVPGQPRREALRARGRGRRGALPGRPGEGRRRELTPRSRLACETGTDVRSLVAASVSPAS